MAANQEPEDPSAELSSMRQRMSEMEEALSIQRRIAYAQALFQGDITVRTLVESLAEGILVVDRTGTIILANGRAATLFGYDQNDLAGLTLNVLLPERFLPTHQANVANFFRRPHVRSMGQGMDLSGRRRDGSEFPIEVALSYLQTEAGMLGLAFISDISRRKQAERNLMLRNEELDAFAHTVAHELNSSLAVMVTYSQTLAEAFTEMRPEELKGYLETIAERGRKMSRIINELLLFASMRQEDLVPAPVDMLATLREAVRRLAHEVRETGARLALPETLPPAMGYAAWIEEAWVNYLSNGLKYGGEPPQLTVGSTPVGENRVQYWVQDAGAGIPLDQQKHLFNPHVRLDQPFAKGHGLGLSIVRRIMEKLGGEVGVASQPGAGSVFSFTLPAADQAKPAA